MGKKAKKDKKGKKGSKSPKGKEGKEGKASKEGKEGKDGKGKEGKGDDAGRQVCHFRECSKYHQMKVSLLFTFDEDMKCALAEIIQVQVAETTGSEINYRLCHGCHPKYTAAC